MIPRINFDKDTKTKKRSLNHRSEKIKRKKNENEILAKRKLKTKVNAIFWAAKNDGYIEHEAIH